MNDTANTAVTEVAVAEAPTLKFNPETGEFETVTETEVAVTDEGAVATAADVTVH
jgi:hypothetical protein